MEPVAILQPRDASTHALETIDYPHHEIHDGGSFVINEVQNLSTTTAYWMITTPDSTKYSHTIFDIEATGEAYIKITEGADRTGTTLLTAINRRRVGTPTVATLVMHRGYSGGTTDGATTIFEKRIGATGVGGKTLTGGGVRGLNEYILKPNTKYVIAVTTYADIYVSGQLDWYEHTDKETIT